MIIREPKTYTELLFAIKGSIIPRVFPHILGFFLFSTLIEALFQAGVPVPDIPVGPMAGIGIALSLFLGFRNNAAYDRWWEGRKIWGSILADVRNLCRELELFLQEAPTRKTALLHIHRFVGSVASTNSAEADAALDAFSEEITAQARAERIGEIGQLTITNRMAALTASQASIERLKSTPLPFVYSLLIHRTVFVYCSILPFALSTEAAWFSPLIVGVTAYVFFGLAAVTDCLEDPFADSEHAVPVAALAALCQRKIETTIGMEQVTPEVGPVDYVLR